jgi:1,2-diacylglycerol 3-alpha-glucosyltransferase
MNIGFFTESYLPSQDGVASSVALAATQLKKMGHNVTIVAPGRPHVKKEKNVYRITSVKLLDSPEVWEAIELPEKTLIELFQKDFDIIHIHSGGTVTNIGWQVAKLHGIPLVLTYHTLWKYYSHYFPFSFLIQPWIFKELSYMIGSTCNALIAPTEKVKKILRTYGIRKPIYVIPNGIDLQSFSHNAKGYLQEKYNIPHSRSILLCVGRLEKEKSPHFILTSFSHLLRKYPHAVLVFVGEGREKEDLQNMAKELHIEANVLFTDALPYIHMPKVYADADISVFASKTETQGMVIYESLAAGLPIVAVQNAAFTPILVDGYNCFTTDKDPVHFANKVHHLLKDKDLHGNFKNNAQKSVRFFSVEHTVKQLEECYINILTNKK